MNLVRKQTGFFPSVFNDFFEKDWSQGAHPQVKNNKPAVNIKENEKQIELELAVPGFKKENIDLSVTDRVLKIKGTNEASSDEKDKYRRREFNFTTFERSFRLLNSIETTKISAAYNDGILSVTLPKKEVEVSKATSINID